MASLEEQADAATAGLAYEEPDALYAELGRRAYLLTVNPAMLASFELPPAQVKVQTQGVGEDFRAFGETFLASVSERAYGLLCGPAKTPEKVVLNNAFVTGLEAAAGALALFLVAQLGMLPAIATAVAVLLLKLSAAGTLEAFCTVWKTKLPAA